jgi:GNAT superfamily N-acetyltransferase
MTPYQCVDPCDWGAILSLLRAEFAYMQGRIDPPSSLAQLTPQAIADHAQRGEVWAIGTPPVACVFLTPTPDALYIGKLAVASAHRRKGLAAALIALAETRARALGKPALELQTRVELAENHAAWRAMGFAETARTAHPGYRSPTSITYRKPLGHAP